MTKKRKWIMPVCLLLVFLLLLGLYFILKRKNASEEEAESSKIQVLSVESGKVEKFSFQTEDESASFSKKDDEWKNDDDKEFPVDQDALETLLESITSLEAERKLENVDGLSEYGLEDPSDTITVQDERGTKNEILVGNKNQSTGDYYISLQNEPNTVYVVSEDLASLLPENVMELAESESYPSAASSDVVEIKVDKTQGSYDLKLNKDTSEWEVTGENGITYSAEYQNVSSLASSLTGIVYSGLMDYSADDLSIYGLDQPAAVIYLKYEEEKETEEDSSTVSASSEEEEPEIVEKEMTLYVGNQDEDGNYYVRMDGSSQVHTVAKDSLSTVMENNSVSYWSSSIGYISVNNLKSVEISYQGEIRAIQRRTEKTGNEDGEEETTVTYVSGETTLDTDKTEDFLYTAASISAQSKDPSLEAPKSAEFTMTVNTESETFTVSYTSYNENFYLAVDSEGRTGLVNRNDAEKLIEEYQAIWS